MARSVRQQRHDLAQRLRTEGTSWPDIAAAIREQWPDLTARQAMRHAHCWTQADACDRWQELFPDIRRPEDRELGRWERWPGPGGIVPSWANLDRLAEIYQCSAADLLADVFDHRHLDRANYKVPATTGERIASEETPTQEEDEERASPIGVDLWELHEALLPKRLNPDLLDIAEQAATQLGTRFPELPPRVLSRELQHQFTHVVGWMREPQPVAYRRRLCSLVGHLAGLRAWLLFDMADHDAADTWFSAAWKAGAEIEDDDLCSWLLGARSLIPTDRGDHHAAAALIETAQHTVAQGAKPTTRAWLALLEARTRASMGDREQFAMAQERAAKLPTSADERRHGMDFVNGSLDRAYYAGLSLLALREPRAASESFRAGLDALPENRVKARGMLTVSVALAATAVGQHDEAQAFAGKALDLVSDQPVRRVWQRAVEVRAALNQAGAAHDLDPQLESGRAMLEQSDP